MNGTQIQELVGLLLLRNESCDTVQKFRDKIFKSNIKKYISDFERVGLDTNELLTSFGYSSLPYVWNTVISRGRNVRNIDELWFYVWANHLENTGAHAQNNGDFPERLSHDQEAVIRAMVAEWENNILQLFASEKETLFSLTVIPEKDFLIVGMGGTLLEDYPHPLTDYLNKNSDLLVSKSGIYINSETGDEMKIYNFIAPVAFKAFLESYTNLRRGTAYLADRVSNNDAKKIFENKLLIQTELALHPAELSFDKFSIIHKNILKYK